MPVLLLVYGWHYLGGRPIRHIKWIFLIFHNILYLLIGSTISTSKIVTRATFLLLQRVWDFFSRDDEHLVFPRYTHEPLWDKRSIRLLHLSRGSPFGRVRYKLTVHGIDSRPSYEAISYTWGDPTFCRPIIIDDCELMVTSNAFDVLQQRATFWKVRTIWIDSICINQDDENEKSIQSPLMREIYSRASSVLVWLGSQPDSRIAMSFLANLHRRLRLGGLEGSELKTILQIGTTSPNWPALFTLLNHSYWTRSWVIQEIAVAETVNIFYGNAILSWDFFSSTIEMLHTQDVGGLFIVSSIVAPPRTMPFRGAGCIRSISRIRSTIKQQSGMELIELLYYSAKSDSTLAKDKIFALLGMADTAAQSALSGMYRRKVQDIFVAATCFLFSQRDPLRVLYHAGIGHPRKTPDLPSWAVDWSSPSGSRNFWRPPDFLPYRASGANVLQLSVHSTLPLIEIRGQCIDEMGERYGRVWYDVAMDETSSLLEKAKNRMLAQQDAISIVNSLESTAGLYCNGQSREEALWRTLIGDRGYGTRPAPAHYRESYEASQRIFAGARGTILSEEVSNNILHETYPGIPLEHLPAKVQADDVTARKFHTGMGEGLHQRKFAVSKKEGYFMLVPELAKPGDLICVFVGAQTPFLVRHVGGNGMGDQRYELVGECYVHGIMDGEVVFEEDLQTFILV
ncbi:HET-domain-containing protein [Hyaloscypha hepaticicola]|uniref:HET-domain-containing protein n=1 Tax=Hyaloscypha hepaticicola TaxID=2082293 RepID=A0A2J6PKZ7_9HELO|nr:HET-domain-containing protein [Hyaloscypha hepaticicola]